MSRRSGGCMGAHPSSRPVFGIERTTGGIYRKTGMEPLHCQNARFINAPVMYMRRAGAWARVNICV